MIKYRIIGVDKFFVDKTEYDVILYYTTGVMKCKFHEVRWDRAYFICVGEHSNMVSGTGDIKHIRLMQVTRQSKIGDERAINRYKDIKDSIIKNVEKLLSSEINMFDADERALSEKNRA